MVELEGNIINVKTNSITSGRIVVEDGLIKSIEENGKNYSNYLAPGFIDAHIHIESSMLCPSRFAEAVIPHGTTSVITDPHEIANVMGLAGIDYMIKDAERVPLNVYFTAPSCVPATPFETAGAVLGAEEIKVLLARPEVVALGEMMNFPGVVNDDEEVMAKLDAAKQAGKPIDGHAPMLSGADLKKYIDAGISTDHECTTLEEAHEKAKLGMRIMLREGSASKNMGALAPIAKEFDNCLLVSDDKHPEDLRTGHVDEILRKAVEYGIDPLRAVAMVTRNPGEHYRLGRGLLEQGLPADIIEFNNLRDFKVSRVYIGGKLWSENGANNFETMPIQTASTITVSTKKSEDFKIISPLGDQSGTGKKIGNIKVRVIEIVPDSIITKELIESITPVKDALVPEPGRDILKLSVVNRYHDAEISSCFISGFGLKEGAVAASVAHDSHNIIAVGADDSALARAVNTVIGNQGGFVVTNATGKELMELKLPVAGLMSTEHYESVADKLKELQAAVSSMGSELTSPFLTLSFMALLVIPELKLSDKGLFDGRSFQFVDIIE